MARWSEGLDPMKRFRVLITSGPTREPLDPVRYLSNASSGRMGAALAAEALRRGCDVDVVSGPAEFPLPRDARVVRASTAESMLAAALELHPRCDILIGAAAVCDFRPRAPLASKRAREGGSWNIELVPNPDILAALGKRKGERIHAGFALETGAAAQAIARARAKLEAKNLDWIVLNPAESIGAESSRFRLLPRSGQDVELGVCSKEDLARELLLRLLPQGR
jgi:phosphopantothenoylcysteine decarboxylase/phosphopantothenate--cysteine ligase